ncbi:hypothetical protein [Lentzea sp. NPDC051838]|uniref:hypothetical protein n=1 Tax=Lentzea sp. NPDC051838 TaxID=3154849 RepID=UPI00344AE1EB
MTVDDIPVRSRVTALENLDNVVCTTLANDDAREGLPAALKDCPDVSPEVRASVEAACEHFGYGERMEARTLLTVAHRLLSRVRRPVRG